MCCCKPLLVLAWMLKLLFSFCVPNRGWHGKGFSFPSRPTATESNPLPSQSWTIVKIKTQSRPDENDSHWLPCSSSELQFLREPRMAARPSFLLCLLFVLFCFFCWNPTPIRSSEFFILYRPKWVNKDKDDYHPVTKMSTSTSQETRDRTFRIEFRVEQFVTCLTKNKALIVLLRHAWQNQETLCTRKVSQSLIILLAGIFSRYLNTQGKFYTGNCHSWKQISTHSHTLQWTKTTEMKECSRHIGSRIYSKGCYPNAVLSTQLLKMHTQRR